MQDIRPDTSHVVIDAHGLQCLIDALSQDGRRVVGPTVRDEAIVYDDIAGLGSLPRGWTDRQEAGRYALERREDEACFGYVVGPHSWKKFLFPPVETLWKARREDDGTMAVSRPERPADRFAFIGVRACEIEAIAIQDRVFEQGPYTDTAYAARRSDAFIVAVNCGQAGGTCFCVSMETGPRATHGFDLALTEMIEGAEHRFLVEIGSEEGRSVMAQVPHVRADEARIGAASAIVERTAAQMGRHLDTDGLKELLQGNLEHPRWDDVADRCLTCANCTMVCPTCFCSTVEDHSDLANREAERVRKWDSCFTMDFSYIHGGSVRASTASRYRQWMTHKLANWIDQFGTSGCVGCGRCITWCPVGIDLTQEAAAIRATPGEGRS
ncbi:4Fe-4S dicluster domain-containing protein [Novosphingobium malaysiense]|uniref:4Fe-4S dicluster domain-containing protein n=1 Tax=Novosphingobium malaysiense TaxID=1348853 RepID=UPI00068BE522|nr:4Fe-4S dicluster domain-containing protein [Novosphingobium malaysiense]